MNDFEDVMKTLIFWIQGIEKTLSGKNTAFQDAAERILNEAKNHEKCKGISFIFSNYILMNLQCQSIVGTTIEITMSKHSWNNY